VIGNILGIVLPANPFNLFFLPSRAAFIASGTAVDVMWSQRG